MSDKRPQKARESGFYTVGTNQFYLHKGDFVPEDAENVFYEEPEETVTAEDTFAAKLVDQENAVDEEGETTSDDEIVDNKGNSLLNTSDTVSSQSRKNVTNLKGK